MLTRALTLLATGLAALATLTVLVGLRAFWSEWRSLRPPRGAPALPQVAELAGLEPVAWSGSAGTIHGWIQASRNGASVLLVHGLGGDRSELVPQARLLARHGYGVLLMDLPGHGESEGRVSGGEQSLDALRGAVELLRARAPSDRLGGYGFSFGGCVLLEAAAGDPRLVAIAVEGAPSELERQLAYEHRAWGAPALWGGRLALRMAGFDLDVLHPLDAARRLAPRALLVIQGEQDATVSPRMARELFDAAGPPRELWAVPTAGHGDAIAREPREYEERLMAFFSRHLLAAR